jgi:integrase
MGEGDQVDEISDSVAVLARLELRRPALPARADPATNPALVYLRSVSASSRPTLTSALRSAIRILGADCKPAEFPWEGLRYADTSALRSVLAEGSRSTANKTLAAVKGCLQEAWRLGLITDADYLRAVDIKGIKGNSIPAGRAVGIREMRALFEVCSADPSPAGARDAAMLAVAIGCGLRRSELAKLDLADYVDEVLVIRRAKGNRTREVPLSAGGGAPALEAWLAVRGGHDGPMFHPINRGGRIDRTKRMSGEAVLSAFARRTAAAGGRPFKPHDLRRTFVGDLLDAGVDLATVQRLAGHVDPATTSRYDRRPARAMRDGAARLTVPYVPRQTLTS